MIRPPDPSGNGESAVDGQPNRTFTSRSATSIGLLNLTARVIERLAAFGLILLIAFVYGAGVHADLFFIASIGPLMVGTVVGESFAGTILPVLLRREEERGLDRLLADSFWLVFGVLMLLLTLYLGAAVAVVEWEAPAGSGRLAPWLAFAPMLVILGLSSYFSAVLLLFESYVWPPFRTAVAALASVIFSGIALLFTRDVAWVAVAVTAGYALSLLLLVVDVRRTHRLGAFLKPSGAGVRDFLGLRRKLGALLVGGLLGGQLFVLVERTMAASLGVGAVATLSYARGVVFTPNLLAQAVATGTYPGMLRANVAEDRRFVTDSFVRALRLTLFISVVVTTFFVVYAVPIATVLFERGALTGESVARIGNALAGFGLAVLGSMLLIFTAKVFLAIDLFRGIVWSQLAVLIAYVPLALPLRGAAGTTGLALAFSFAEAFGGLVSVAYAARTLDLSLGVSFRSIVLPVARSGIPVVAALLSFRVLVEVVASSPADPDALLLLLGGGAVGLCAVSTSLWVAGWPETERLRDAVRSSTRRLLQGTR